MWIPSHIVINESHFRADKTLLFQSKATGEIRKKPTHIVIIGGHFRLLYNNL